MKLNNFGFGAGSGGGADAITGSGTANKLAKFTDANIIGNSLITDDGSTVYIGSSATSAKAAFEINSTTQGVLLPRLTTTQINAIAIGAATNSLLVYSTTANRFRYYNHASADVNKWETLATLNDIPAAPTTLYSGDGSLSSSRTVTMGVNSLLFAGNITTFRGIGTTSATSSLLVQDSGSNDLFRVRNDGAVISTNGYWQGTAKILYINPNSTVSNVFIGQSSGNTTMTGDYNVGLGFLALSANTSGNRNIAIGFDSLRVNTSGYHNMSMGMDAMYANTTGNNNIAVGFSSLFNNTTGVQNTAIGSNSLYQNTVNSYNTAIGHTALATAQADYNTAIGWASQAATTTGTQNTSIGVGSMNVNTTGGFNTAIGTNSLITCTSGSKNTIIGHSAGSAIVSSTSNVFIGYQAGVRETGSNTFFIDNIDRGTEADGRLKALIYGIFAAATTNQYVNLNANTNTPLAHYNYMAASNSADTVGDVRTYATYVATVSSFIIEKCTVANATKGGGTWVNINSFSL